MRLSRDSRCRGPAEWLNRPAAGADTSDVARLCLVSIALVLTGACATGGGLPRPFPSPGGGSAATADGAALAGTALSLRGTPYRNGGADPAGFDCSGFVHYVFGQHGIEVPRTVTALYRAGPAVRAVDLRPGDLLFFSTIAPGPSHVAIAVGGDEFVHAPSTRGEVRAERLSSGYWSTRFVGARRVH
jgi:peptidoglycan DL-endopeptidase CwlO